MQVVIGIFIGIFIGIVFMCLFQVNREIDSENDNLCYEIKIRKAIDKWKRVKEDKQKEYDLKEYKEIVEQIEDRSMIIIAQIVAEELENML